jgi:hypothetical protein
VSIPYIYARPADVQELRRPAVRIWEVEPGLPAINAAAFTSHKDV